MTAAFERLQTLTTTLDRIVSEVTPLSGVQDVDAFEGELRNMKGKTEMSMQEIGRLTGDLKREFGIDLSCAAFRPGWHSG